MKAQTAVLESSASTSETAPTMELPKSQIDIVTDKMKKALSTMSLIPAFDVEQMKKKLSVEETWDKGVSLYEGGAVLQGTRVCEDLVRSVKNVFGAFLVHAVVETVHMKEIGKKPRFWALLKDLEDRGFDPSVVDPIREEIKIMQVEAEKKKYNQSILVSKYREIEEMFSKAQLRQEEAEAEKAYAIRKQKAAAARAIFA